MSWLLADIGGTNTRCAINPDGGRPINLQNFGNSDFPGPLPLLQKYLASLSTADAPPTRGLFAVAAPIRGDAVTMINIDWRFSAASLCTDLGLSDLQLLNDFEALAYALPELDAADVLKLGDGEPLPDRPKAVLGPGTGLGVASLIPVAGGWQAVGGEGGHVTLAATDDREEAIIRDAREQFGHCSAERLISGPGLTVLHAALHDQAGLQAAEIGHRANAGDPAAAETLEVFFRLLGTVAANLALTLGAFGGVYIGGGIIPRQAARFARSGFRESFEAKGRYHDYLRSIPTYLITSDNPTIMGLSARACV